MRVLCGIALWALVEVACVAPSTVSTAKVEPLAPLAVQVPRPPPDALSVRRLADARILLDALARFTPERLAPLGLSGLDTEVTDLGEALGARSRAALDEAIGALEARLCEEKTAALSQDLEILLRAARQFRKGSELEERDRVPYTNPFKIVFSGVRALVSERIDAERRRAVLVRLRRYAGLEASRAPIAWLAEERTRERMDEPGLVFPNRAKVEQDLADAPMFLSLVRSLVGKLEPSDAEEGRRILDALEPQLRHYAAFVRREILPRTTTDFHMPRELYAFELEKHGIDLEPEALITQARASFERTRQEMERVAAIVAAERGLSSSAYRDVIRELKRERLHDEELERHYRDRLHTLEAVIEREQLVTLPKREVSIRLSSGAEAAGVASPHVSTEALLSEGAPIALVLPLVGSVSDRTPQADDFAFRAASWGIAAHEGRPGHELQLSAVAEHGLSLTRILFAMNAVNVEGWGLYAESLIRPFMPAEGRLIALQFLLSRAARAFLDPALHLGLITPEEARRVLEDEVVQSSEQAEAELRRSMTEDPGQAGAHFVGYMALSALREEVESRLGARFVPREFHDFVVAQGLLPPALLRKAVLESFLPGVVAVRE